MRLLSLFALLLFFACENSAAPAADAPPQENTTLATTPPNTETTGDPIPGQSISDILPAATMAELLDCSSDVNAGDRNRDDSKSCSYTCTSPFKMCVITLRWSKDGQNFDQSDLATNPSFETVSVAGADEAYLQTAQNRLNLSAGNLAIQVNLAGQTKEEAIRIAEAFLKALP